MIIADYDQLRRRNGWAIGLGGVLGLLGTVAVIAAFTLPPELL